VVQIAPYTAQKTFREHTNSAENSARPQKLSHARVTNELFSTFLTHLNVRTQISNGSFLGYMKNLQINRESPQKRSHLSVAI